MIDLTTTMATEPACRPGLQQAIGIAERRFQLEDKSDHHVMVARMAGRETHRRHVRLYRDTAGLYVRLGKRGGLKRYLHDMAGGRIVDNKFNLCVFFEY